MAPRSEAAGEWIGSLGRLLNTHIHQYRRSNRHTRCSDTWRRQNRRAPGTPSSARLQRCTVLRGTWFNWGQLISRLRVMILLCTLAREKASLMAARRQVCLPKISRTLPAGVALPVLSSIKVKIRKSKHSGVKYLSGLARISAHQLPASTCLVQLDQKFVGVSTGFGASLSGLGWNSET